MRVFWKLLISLLDQHYLVSWSTLCNLLQRFGIQLTHLQWYIRIERYVIYQGSREIPFPSSKTHLARSLLRCNSGNPFSPSTAERSVFSLATPKSVLGHARIYHIPKGVPKQSPLRGQDPSIQDMLRHTRTTAGNASVWFASHPRQILTHSSTS